ncbi:MAG: FG-GAP repeat protein [Chitinophagaceae bacterium]|nr:FG-GAP repeat protein [Chitinophagaceae bacterium]
MLENNLAGSTLGTAVAGAGDVNGDGYSDVVVGSMGYSNVESTEGAAFVFHGYAAGLSTTPNSTPDDADQFAAQFGISIACAGDVNGDGYSDVIIGAWQYDDGFVDEGKAFVYHGSATGLSATPNSTPDDADQAGAWFGESVAGAGDVNGDGYSDVIIGAYKYDDGFVDEGKAFVYHGSAAGLSASPVNTPDDADQLDARFGVSVAGAGDVNGDGYSDVIIGCYRYNDGASTDEGLAFVYHGSATGLSSTPNSTPDDANQTFAQFGYSVAGAGDVNGDGYSDVIIGAFQFDNGQTDEGTAFVYHGSATGISNNFTAMVESNQATAYFGCSVASAGDVNGEGYGDVIVGAYWYDDGINFDEGRAFVYHGSATGIGLSPNSTLDDADLNGAQFGISVAGAGDVNGDGYSDVIIGANLLFLYNGNELTNNKRNNLRLYNSDLTTNINSSNFIFGNFWCRAFFKIFFRKSKGENGLGNQA